jgi:hypothetical protein
MDERKCGIISIPEANYDLACKTKDNINNELAL